MSILTDTVIEWNEIALTAKCISDPDLHALTDAFNTRDTMSIITQLPELFSDPDKFNELYLQFNVKKAFYLNDIYREANKASTEMTSDLMDIMTRDQAIRIAVKESMKYIHNNEQLLHNKKECHCYC